MRTFHPRRTNAVLLLIVFGCTTALAQPSAPEILDRMVASFDEQTQNVDDYTVVGDYFTSYHKKYVDATGRPYFKTATEDDFSGNPIGNMTTRLHTDNPYELRERIADKAEYAGSVVVRGIEAHKLVLSDFSGFALDPAQGPPPESVEFYVDAERWVLLRLIMHPTQVTQRPGGPVTPTFDFEDYRETEGLLYPFLMRVTMVGAEVTVTQAQVDEAQSSIDQLETRLADLPVAMRDQMMRRIQPQIERMQAIVDSGTLETLFRVQKVKVNTGLSDTLFQ